jgi:hypothetical protein
VVLILVAATAHADPEPDADALTAQGEQLARDGEYSRAVQLFKQAEAKAPSAKHACLIGLAYTRRELWSQAEIWLDRCKERATAQDPLPEWFSAATAQLAEKLKAVDTAPLEIKVTPPTANAKISVSSFPPDETFAARTIHLVPGTYVLTGTVPGQPPITQTVTVKLGAANTVTLAFSEPPQRTPVPRTVEATREPSNLSTYLFVGGGVLAAVGVGFHVVALRERGTLQDAQDANDPTTWRAHDGKFETERAVAIGCYTGAAIAVVAGILLRARHEDAPAISASLTPGGAMVGIEVSR